MEKKVEKSIKINLRRDSTINSFFLSFALGTTPTCAIQWLRMCFTKEMSGGFAAVGFVLSLWVYHKVGISFFSFLLFRSPSLLTHKLFGEPRRGICR